MTAGSLCVADGGECRLQLAPSVWGKRRVCRKHLGQAGQPFLIALHQLGLELDEAIDDPRAGHDVDLVEAQLHPGLAVAHDPLAAQLADGDELDQRRVPGQLQDQRTGIRRRPLERSRRPIRGSLELLPTNGAARATGSRQRLDRDDRVAPGPAKADRKARPGQRSAGGVHVAVLELGRPGGRAAAERADRIGHQVALGGREIHHPELQLHFNWPASTA